MIEVILYSAVTIVILGAYWWNENKWHFITPTNDSDWIPNHQRLVFISATDGVSITIHNIRNTKYFSKESYEPQYFDKRYLLQDIQSAGFHISNKLGITVHVFITFTLNDGSEIAISIKPRRRKSLPKYFSDLFIIINPPEIIYTIATKIDIFAWRTKELNEKIVSYKLLLNKEQLQRCFIDLVTKADKNTKSPKFYSLISNNCFTNIFNSINKVAGNALPAHHYSYTFSPLLGNMLLKRGLIDKE